MVVVVYIIGKIVHKLISIIALGFLNRLVGGIFGLAKCAVILSVILYFVNGFDHDSSLIKPEIKKGSYLYDPVESIVPLIIPRLDLDRYDLPDRVDIPEVV